MNRLDISFWKQLTDIGTKAIDIDRKLILSDEIEVANFLTCIDRIVSCNNNKFLTHEETIKLLKIRSAVANNNILPLFEEEFDMFRIPISFEEEKLDISINDEKMVQTVRNVFEVKKDLSYNYYKSLFFMWADKENIEYKKKSIELRLIEITYDFALYILKKYSLNQQI